MLEQKLQEYYSNDVLFKQNIDKIFKDKCAENKCKLQGDLQKYVILDGDAIQECMKKDDINSVDCILIKETSEGKFNILLCELDKGSSGKSVTYVKNKMQGSGNHIIEVFKQMKLNVNQLKCLYLGKYKIKPKRHSLIRVPIRGFPRKDINIVNNPCGFTVKDSFF